MPAFVTPIKFRSLQTYSASGAWNTPAAATDVFEFYGIAGLIFYIHRIMITGSVAAAEYTDIFAVRRSTANTGGTVVALPVAKHDSTFPGAQGVPREITATRTGIGTQAGEVRRYHPFLPISTSTTQNFVMDWKFGEDGFAPIVLRGASEGFCVAQTGSALIAIILAIEWSETTT
jgi:hypothetical protein